MVTQFKRISDMRIDNDLTQERIANILETSRNCYAQWERGYCNFPLEKLNKYANYHHTSFDYLTGLTDEKNPCYCSHIDQELIAKRMKKLRKLHNYSQEQLCQIINIKQRTYSGYETKRSCPTLSVLYSLAKCYHVSLDYLSGRKKEL